MRIGILRACVLMKHRLAAVSARLTDPRASRWTLIDEQPGLWRVQNANASKVSEVDPTRRRSLGSVLCDGFSNNDR